jgi:hypothetical protein
MTPDSAAAALILKDTSLFFSYEEGGSFGLDVDVFLNTAESDGSDFAVGPVDLAPVSPKKPKKKEIKQQPQPTEEELRAERHKRLQRIFLALDREEAEEAKRKVESQLTARRKARSKQIHKTQPSQKRAKTQSNSPKFSTQSNAAQSSLPPTATCPLPLPLLPPQQPSQQRALGTSGNLSPFMPGLG